MGTEATVDPGVALSSQVLVSGTLLLLAWPLMLLIALAIKIEDGPGGTTWRRNDG